MHSKETIDLDYVPFPNPDVIIQEEGDGKAVLVNLDTGNAVSLNAMSRFIWDIADGFISVAGVIDKIKQSYDSVPDDISEEVTSIINVLKTNGFFGFEIKGINL